ncbi:UNVERIFIED_CONTAM: hypothetical protein FKN15_074685 [Acipenser sinensis]
MAGVFIVFTALLLCLPDSLDGISVRQSPPSLFKSPGHSAELQCYHGDSSYPYMYWYQQRSKGALELIGYLQNAAIVPEEKFKLSETLGRPAVLLLSLQHRHVKMAGVFIVFMTLLLCLPDFSDGNVRQSPPSLSESPGHSAELQCSHDDSSYTHMYWYQQKSKGALELIGYLSYTDVKPEEKFKKRFNLTGDAEKADFSAGINIVQSPPSLFESPGRSAELNCSHDASSNQYMYWYQQTSKGALELIGYLSYETFCEYHAGLYSLYTMAGVFVVLTAFLLCLPDPSERISIEQYPPVGERPGQSAELECHHDDSNYYYMYWYQQSRGEGAFKLIGYAYMTQAATIEDDFKTRFTFTKQATQKGTLTISILAKEDSAIYYCAASKAQCCRSPLSSTKTLHSHSLASVENTSSHHLAFPI